ncbi:hypothetical protein LOTGIDRAFT_233213 [Lottia gigantea]|uniref:RING-type domain-containing protein n=1 Tax=Lottia gigantea TaxID=225164 RepID=V4BSV3_LOTGI|nr:hypothetical protein LOTGIDRAFT_233213 [Lottia gigantea]ESO92159.1 hypothetical protein LOTGIDRAFT_233213 [Lottia gigantea]
MATSLNKLKCPICCDSFKTPKVLPCGHTFCEDCIDVNVCEKTEKFLCLICGQRHKIAEGGAKMLTTNLVLITPKRTTTVTDQPSSTEKPKCPNHSESEVDYYCTDCRLGMCSRCALNDHKDHETLDVNSEETRAMTTEQLERSRRVIRNKIKELESLQATLAETSVKLQTMCDEACAEVERRTENTIAELRERCNVKRQNNRFGR